ncbi:MAG: DUF4402 domain-containing protein [Sphingorhabdus sp.]
MTGPGHKLRAVGALGLLPLLLAAGEASCLLCTGGSVPTALTEIDRSTPLSIEITTKLDFSRAALPASGGGQIELDPHNGNKRVAGGMVDLGGAALAGSAIVTGEPGRAVRIDMPTSARMTSAAGGVVEITGIRTSLMGASRLDSTGRLEFSFGGTLVVRGNVSGTFRARIPITAQYQ